jgi:hypothetical protein
MHDDPVIYVPAWYVRGLNLGELREVGNGALQAKVARAGSKGEIDAVLREARRPSRWKRRGKQRRRTGAKADTADAGRTAMDSG